MPLKNKEREKEYQKQYYLKNKEKTKEWRKEYYLKNREKIIEYQKQYQLENKDKTKERKKKWALKNKERIKSQQKKWQEDNKEKLKKLYKQYYQEHKERLKKLSREWHLKNEEKNREQQKKWRVKMKTDLKWNFNHRMASGINKSLKKGNKNGRHWESLVGYTATDLEKRLKSTMPFGYTWNDFLNGELHIDHIIPVSVFNFTEPEHIDFKRCWALENLRLLPAEDNLRKSNKLYKPFQPALKIMVS